MFVTTRSSSLLPILIGAVAGAATGYLYFTRSGKRTRVHIERWFDDLNAEICQIRSTASNACAAMDEGRRSLKAVWGAAPSSTPPSFERERPKVS